MYEGNLHLSQASQGIFHSSLSSSSLSTSFSSSAASSMLLPATPPSNSSHSDIRTSDQSATAPLPPSSKPHLFPVSASPAPRSSSLSAYMGQSFSRNQPPAVSSAQSPLSAKALALSNTAAATGLKLKRAFAGRRKKSEDTTLTAPQPRRDSKGKERENLDVHPPEGQVHGKRRPQPPVAQSTPDDFPPPPPPKPAGLQTPKTQSSLLSESRVDQRASLVREKDLITSLEKEVERQQFDQKDVWRKSDSTMSYHTIRPGAAVGSRTPRPVSMAESLQSTHTIVPVNKRLSALVTDAEFAMPEEEDGGRTEDEGNSGDETRNLSAAASPTRRTTSPPSSLKSRNRRSISLNLGPSFSPKTKASLSEVSGLCASENDLRSSTSVARSFSDGVQVAPLSSAKDISALTRAAANGIISPSQPDHSTQSTGNSIKGRLAAFSLASNLPTSPLSPSSRAERNLPAIPPQHMAFNSRSAPPTFRQTAISMTSGFAPTGLAKRAVEKMGRAWGGMSSSSSSSGYSSSSSTGTVPSSYSSGRTHDNPLGRTNSNQSVPGRPSVKGKTRRTPNAPSGTWSITSTGTGTSSSLSDSDAFMSSGPMLGTRLRGPIRLAATGAGVAGGIVFGRDLQTCVRDTAVSVQPGLGSHDNDRGPDNVSGGLSSVRSHADIDQNELESRMLPALVVRCAQHLLAWGVQEEGLFRVSGRPSHVAKIRTEFDTGADYDMSQCTPGDLDPHAVSSIFKAYLRELPEPILTYALMPYFDAAMATESNVISSQEIAPQQSSRGFRGQGLPSGPRNGGPTSMRKPPSLTTLAMPNFSGLRPPSESLISALTSLIARLPRENHDLILTVTELIKATAKNSKETKMPLSNLLLVLCPSLNMSPPLLRVLCEASGIWNKFSNSVADPIVVGIKGDNSAPDVRGHDDAEDFGDAGSDSSGSLSDQEEALLVNIEAEAENQHPVDMVDKAQLKENHLVTHSASSSQDLHRERQRSPSGPRPLLREPVSTVYLDAEDSLVIRESAALSSVPSSETASLQDDDLYVSISEGPSIVSSHHSSCLPNPYSPAELSSSAESLATPSTSSGQHSFSHISVSDDPYSKVQPSSRPHSPVIADSTDRPLPTTPRRLAISGPIHFPSTESVPSSPSERRKSIPFLSLPGSPAHSNPSPSSPSSMRAQRLKRPSLHLLFSRRSASPLRPEMISAPSPYLRSRSGLNSDGSSSGSTPISARSMVTAPQSSSFSLPPKLDMPIDSSPLQFGLDMRDGNEGPAHNELSRDNLKLATSNNAIKLEVSSSPALSTPHPTPIANHFRSPKVSILDRGATFPEAPAVQPNEPFRATVPLAASSSTLSIDRLGVLSDDDNPEDDWAQSVLIAADTDGTWREVQGSQ